MKYIYEYNTKQQIKVGTEFSKTGENKGLRQCIKDMLAIDFDTKLRKYRGFNILVDMIEYYVVRVDISEDVKKRDAYDVLIAREYGNDIDEVEKKHQEKLYRRSLQHIFGKAGIMEKYKGMVYNDIFVNYPRDYIFLAVQVITDNLCNDGVYLDPGFNRDYHISDLEKNIIDFVISNISEKSKKLKIEISKICQMVDGATSDDVASMVCDILTNERYFYKNFGYEKLTIAKYAKIKNGYIEILITKEFNKLISS